MEQLISSILAAPLRAARAVWRLIRTIASLLATAFIVGLAMLPLASLLLALPAVLPDESVLSDSVGRSSGIRRFFTRIFALLTSFAVLIALTAVSTEIVSRLPLKSESFVGDFGRTIFGAFIKDLPDRLPPALVNQWHYVLLLVYLSDLLLLFFIGRVPLKYNVRNLMIRARTTALTAVAFTVVVGLLVALLSFVNGVSALTEATGNPANVFILSDSATDESFSNLGYADIDNLRTQRTYVDDNGNRLANPVGIKFEEINGQMVPLLSKETYSVVNMPVPNPGPNDPARRFIQTRAIFDPEVAARVHGITLLPGGTWFSSVGSRGGVVECVIGESLATVLGRDAGKPRLEVGDTFELLDDQFKVVGIMKSEGSMFGSELWAMWQTLSERTGRKVFTTVVARLEDESGSTTRAFCAELIKNFKTPKVSAKPETQYYADLAKSNKQFFYGILAVAAIMAIGGIFGVMNTMFAAIAQRTKEIGVLRILGFKRWQVLTSFMLETLVIALLGGLVGCLLGSLADGLSAKSIVSAGPGGPGGKSVFLKLTVGPDVLVCGLLFTFVMGRLGGFLPSLNAMRLQILDTLR